MLHEMCLLILSILIDLVYSQGLQTCICNVSNTCYQPLPTAPSTGIDIRIVNPGTGVTPAPTATPIQPNTCTGGLQQCCTGAGVTGCGLRYNIPLTPTTVPAVGQGRYGSQPWQAVMLDLNKNYLGGGVLLTTSVVLTAAHKIYGRAVTTIVIRLGDWDANRDVEPYTVQNRSVSAIIYNPGYVDSAKNLLNDLAIIKLSSPVIPSINPAINVACLPTATTNFDNMRCIVSGWGKNAFTGVYQEIIKEVEVPVVSQATCQARLRTTRLGTSYNLDTTSFMCAGGEAGRDACVGDGGSPLMCSVGGRYQVVGLVAWGIGCADATIPGVYVRVQSYLPWIMANL